MPIREMKLKIRVVVEPDEDAGFFAYCPDLQGVAVEGCTPDEIKENMQDAINGYVASLLKHGDPIPIGVLESDETHAILPYLCKKVAEKLGLSKGREYVQEILYTEPNHAAA